MQFQLIIKVPKCQYPNLKLILNSCPLQSMINQQQKPEKKPENLKPFHDLYLRLSFNRQQPQIIPYPLSSDTLDDKNSNLLNIKVDTVLKIASSIILKKKIKLSKFMNIFVEIDHKLVNIFKLKKASFGQSEGNIVKLKRQDQCFYLNVWIIDLLKMQKTNPLLEFTTQNAKYVKIMQKLEHINQVFTKQIQSLNEQQKSSYDIAYFFAQPLVEPQKIQDFPSKISIYQNMKLDKYRASGSDVSFQKEYDKFINVIQAENFFANITIEMMVATENNLRQVLSERCNILHFSCHGVVDYLKIEKDRNVGYLDALTSARLIKLLDGKALPKIIIFNACFSRKIAADVHERFPEITTVGYEGQADDNYCEILTQRLYSGIYGKKDPFFKLFEDVKSEIASKNQQQAKKLYIFKAATQFKFDKTDFAVNQNYNINWGYFENLGQKEPIGIKLKLFEFIRNYLLNNHKTKFFVVGEPESGKSIFIRKALYYTMHRCVFRQKLYIDLRKGQKPIVNMLEMKMQYKRQLYNFIKQHKNTNVIIVVDHCNDLIRNDPEEFMKFFKKVEREIKLGKLILVSDNISYFMEINILIDENVYEYEEIVPAKEPNIREHYNKYMNRWHPNLDKNWNDFLKHKLKQWFEALRASDSKESFNQNLSKMQKKDQDKQSQKLMVDLQAEFNTFRNKIIKSQRKIKSYLTSGYYSRTQQCFILLNIFPEFTTPIQKQQQRSTLQRRQKHSYIQQLSVIYEQDIKGVINEVIQALGKFHTETYEKSWWENQLLFVTQKLFVIVGLAVLVKDSKEGEKEVSQQLFNAYTLVMKLFNRYQKLLSELPRLMSQCEALKLKIYMAMYSFYKHHQLLVAARQKAFNTEANQKGRSEISSVQGVQVGFSINFLQTIPVLEGFREGRESTGVGESGNMSEFGFGVSQRDSLRENNSLTNAVANRERRDSGRSQNDFSSIRPSVYPTTHVSYKSQSEQKRQSVFKDFQNQLKQQYAQSQYWQLIQKSTQLDTIIRTIQSHESRQLSIDPGEPSSTFDFSSSENQRIFQTYYRQVDKFYRLHTQLAILHQGFESCDGFEHSYEPETCRVRKVFFGEVELDLCYLQGLKIVAKLMEVVDDEYFFDCEAWYKERLDNVRDKLIKTQRILDTSIARKLNHNRDLSYKKIYKESLELYIDLRFKLEKLYSSYTSKGEKQLLSIYNKLLKLSEDARSIQLKNRIQQFIEKNFYNKCSLLISEPICYIPKIKQFSFAQHKDTKKPKNNNKKQHSHATDKPAFYPLNLYRPSDIIVNEIKNATEKKVVSQIHVETEILNFQRLSSYSMQKEQEDSRKKRLIYMIVCDCKKSANHETFFIENEYGESVKMFLKPPNSNGFPYAPVIIIYGSNAELLLSYYRQYAQHLQKKIAIIMLPTSVKVPEIDSDNPKELFRYVWNQYLQKQIGMSFLSRFWAKFCQIYFDEQHESFRNQVIRSFNIARQESVILLKKKYLEGLNGSQVEKEIDRIVDRLELTIENQFEADLAVSLKNNLKCMQQKQPEQMQGYNSPQRQEQSLRISTLHESIRRQDQILALNNKQIGTNSPSHQFLKTFFSNIEHFQKDQPCTKNFIHYHMHINQTNMISFAKTIYNKLLRMAGRFQGGVEFKYMEGFRGEHGEVFNVFDEGLAGSMTIEDRLVGDGLEIKEEDSMDYDSDASEEMAVKKQKGVEIYYNVAYKDLKPLLEGFKSLEQSLTTHSHSHTPNSKPTTSFRILLVDTQQIHEDMLYYIKSQHSCHILPYNCKSSYLQNMYHACDAILHYSKKVEGFSFGKVIDELYNKKNPVENLAKMDSRHVKERVVEYFQKHYP